MAHVLSTGYFPFLVGHGKDSERNEGFTPVRQRGFHSEAIRENLVPRGVPNKDVSVDSGATEDIPENACSFMRQYYYGWRFDSIELNEVSG